MSVGDSAAKFVKSRPIAQSKAKPEDLLRYKTYFSHCKRHRDCRKAMKSLQHNIAPTRLLYVQEAPHVQLYKVPEGENPHYVALSYCWGESERQKQAQTMQANVEDRHHGIQESQLPQTITDAIKLTRSLGLAYIWIDALCIIQDDPQDCAAELAKMASIYREAIITIAAASAKSSVEGFLEDRDLEKAYGSLFKLSYRRKRDNDVEGSVLLSENPICDTYDEPIDKRAWTMQEDTLSLRLLRFGSKQTTWRCPRYHGSTKIDGGGCPYPVNKDMDSAIDHPRRITEVQSAMAEFGDLGPSKLLDSWLNSISNYTHRKISKTSDKLPACAALAENFAAIFNLESDEYLAGLWKPDIMAQLLWFRLEDFKAERCSGPTWSWASLHGPVEFFQRNLLEYSFVVKAKARLVNSKMDYKFESHKYSEMFSGRLVLEGLWRQAYWDGSNLRQSIQRGDVLPLEIHWDISGLILPQTVWCLEIIGSYISLGLVLTTKNLTDFERVGFFECDTDYFKTVDAWFNEVEKQIITIH
jgi:hypothetical protein